jgi:4-amino-4-deoxy-L-arabinose transferase-like glycosyltransferase
VNREKGKRPPWEEVRTTVLVLAITLLGLWLRWLYVRDISFFVDEYITIRAAVQILDRGVPLLPSGNFYSHGLLLSYLEAILVGLGAEKGWLLRLPPLLFSTAAIPLLCRVGRRMVSSAAGLVAAALLALSPESILWGGRVRMYAPLHFFVLLATYFFFVWVVRKDDRPPFRLLFVVTYWAALFSHAEAMLLLPIWGLWALVQRGWRWSLRWANLLTFGLSSLAIVIEMLLRRIGPAAQGWVAPGVFESVGRQYLGAGIDWSGVQKIVEPLFLAPIYLPFTLLALVGLPALLLIWKRKSESVGPAEKLAAAYLYALVMPVLFALLFVVDASWKSPRYALMLLPHFFLIAASWLTWLGRWLQARSRLRLAWLGSTVIIALIVLGSWPSAVAATRASVPDYEWGFGYVEKHEQAGDLVVTFLCPAAFQHLGRCDYLAIPDDFVGFAFQENDRWVSGWDGVPILDSPEGLRAILGGSQQVWFVVDEGRFAGRYPADFLQAVWDGMDLVAAEREILVFHSRPPSTPGTGLYQERRIDFEGGISLVGYELAPQDPEPGQDLSIVLHWQARSPVWGHYTAFVHLTDEDGKLLTQVDQPPLRGLYPTTQWRPGPTMPDRYWLSLPDDMASGRYRLVVGLYQTHTRETLPAIAGKGVLDYLWIGPRPAVSDPEVRLGARFGDSIQLRGYDLSQGATAPVPPGTDVAIRLHWESIARVEEDYTVFVHLVDSEGQIQAQADGPPLAGRYPTSFWKPGELLQDDHTLVVGEQVRPGKYRILAGLYLLKDGSRLAVTAGPQTRDDAAVLTTLEVSP